MPDISMCSEGYKKCDAANACRRSPLVSKPSEFWQAYASFQPGDDGSPCEFVWPWVEI